jgi:hypothetical protein
MNLAKYNPFAGAVAVASAFMLSMVPFSAMAAISLPEADVLADIGVIVLFITAIGAAVLGLIYVARGFQWAKKAG